MRLLSSICLLFACITFGYSQIYFPGRTDKWSHKTPAEAGLNADSIRSAIKYAQENESTGEPNLEINHYLNGFGREPYGDGVGPFKTRGAQSGVILKDGYIIAEWGEPERCLLYTSPSPRDS